MGSTLLLVLYFPLGLRLNLSNNAPIGLYKTVSTAVSQGDYVAFCPPETTSLSDVQKINHSYGENCNEFYGYKIKQIAGVPNDQIVIDDMGVWINHQLIPHTVPFKGELDRTPSTANKVISGTIPEGKVLLLTDPSNQPFGIRYFGLIDKKQISNKVIKLVAL